MNKLIKTIKRKGTGIVIVALFIATTFLVLITFNLLYTMSKNNLTESKKHTLSLDAGYLAAEIKTVQDLLLSSRDLANRIINENSEGLSNQDFFAYLDVQSVTIQSSSAICASGLYGLFDGEYYDSDQNISEDAYDYTSRPWYILAVEADGEPVLTEPYTDFFNGNEVATISVLLDDKKSVLAIDINTDIFYDAASFLATEHGFSDVIIMSDHGNAVVHAISEGDGSAKFCINTKSDNGICQTILDMDVNGDEAFHDGREYLLFAEDIIDGFSFSALYDKKRVFDSLGYIVVWLGLFIIFVVSIVAMLIRSAIRRGEKAESLLKEIGCLANPYISVHKFGITDNTIIEIKAEPYVREAIDAVKKICEGDMQRLIRIVMDKLTSESSKAAMMEFVDFSTICERTINKNSISLEFVGIHGWARASIIVVDKTESGAVDHFLWTVEWIDDSKQEYDRLRYLSQVDQMTGIRNRASGEAQVREALQKGQKGMFCVMDGDRFKAINDTYGHIVGDKVIVAFAETLQDYFSDDDIVLRLGGDEFAVYVKDVEDSRKGRILLEGLTEKLKAGMPKEISDFNFTVSIGAAFYDGNCTLSFDKLYKRADDASYKAKAQEGNTICFSEKRINDV